MLTLSIKNLLVGVFVVCFLCLVLTNPSMLMAKAMILIVVVSILALTAVGFWLRRPFAFVLVFLSIGYLVVADGGTFPSAERYLPTERVLERCCQDGGTEIITGFKFRRSRSLTKWVLAVDPDHYDWRHVNPAKPTTNTNQGILAKSQSDTDDALDELLNNVDSSPEAQTYTPVVSIQLPAMTVTKVSTVVSFRARSSARNRPYFIVGHCLFVTLLLAVAIAYLIATSKRTCATNSNRGVTRA